MRRNDVNERAGLEQCAWTGAARKRMRMKPNGRACNVAGLAGMILAR